MKFFISLLFLFLFVLPLPSKAQEYAPSVNLYLISWGAYYLTQTEVINKNASFNNYKKNFGKIVFDHDEPIWNWVVHPYTGALQYMYFKTHGINNWNAFVLTLINSTLFEFTIENLTEPASLQDLYQTPVFGSIIGHSLYEFSQKMLTGKSWWQKLTGYIINPTALFINRNNLNSVSIFPNLFQKNIYLSWSY